MAFFDETHSFQGLDESVYRKGFLMVTLHELVGGGATCNMGFSLLRVSMGSD